MQTFVIEIVCFNRR